MDRLFNGTKPDLKMSYKCIPTVVFSHPPIGTVGYEEEQAKKEFGEENINVYKSKFTNMFYSLAKEDKYKQMTLMKLICKKEADKEVVIGFAGIGKSIDELTQVVAILVVMGASKQDFDNTIAVHPSASEEFVLMQKGFNPDQFKF